MDPVENATDNGPGKRTILEMRNVSKTYGGSRALRSASLKIREAEIHSLTGSILAASSMLGLIVSLVPNYSFLGFEAFGYYWRGHARPVSSGEDRPLLAAFCRV